MVRFKSDLQRFPTRFNQIINSVPAFLGLWIAYLGFASHQTLLLIFGALGPLSVWGYFRNLKNLLSPQGNYIEFHIQTMVGSGIGSIVISALIGKRRGSNS